VRRWLRTVTYVIEADTLEQARENWSDDGPIVAEGFTVQVAAESLIEPETPEGPELLQR
jgi:hypothetical protein